MTGHKGKDFKVTFYIYIYIPSQIRNPAYAELTAHLQFV